MDAEPPGCGCPFLTHRIAHSHDFRRDVDAAVRLGISYKRFSGWEPKEVTEHTYDESGRLVRSVTTRESEWDDEERGTVLALGDYEHSLCGGCGGYLPETTQPGAAYEATLPHKCFRCAAVHSKQKEYEKNADVRDMAIWPVKAKPRKS